MLDPLQKMKSAAQAFRRAIPSVPEWMEATSPEAKEGEKHLQAGDYASAEECFRIAASQAKSKAASRQRQVRILLRLGSAQWSQGKLEEARETALTAQELLEGAAPRATSETGACLELLGNVCLSEGDAAGARTHFQQALEVEQGLRHPDLEVVSDRYRRLAEACRAEGDLDRSSLMLKYALDAAERGPGERHATTAKCLMELGKCEQSRGNHDEAKAYLERALGIHRELHGPESEDVARGYQALAEARQAAGDYKDSVSYYEKALQLRERQLGGNTAEFAMLLVAMGEVYSKVGRFAPAVEMLQHAVGKLEGTHDTRLASVLQKLGAVYTRCGRYREAAEVLGRARHLWEESPQEHYEELEANSLLINESVEHLGEENVLPLVAPQRKAYVTSREDELPAFLIQPGSTAQPAGAAPALHAAPAAAAPPEPVRIVEAPAVEPAGVQADLVGADGGARPRPAGVPAPGPVHLTIVVPDSVRLSDQAALKAAPLEPEEPEAVLHGWEDLSFDLMQLQ